MSYSPFACNWQNRFWNSEPVVSRFPSNKGGNSDIRIPHNSVELHPAPCMRVVCCVRRLGPSCMLKQNVLSLTLLISLVELTNQKRGIYRHRILYPLRLGLLFPNDGKILRPKVSLGLNQIEIDLRKDFFFLCFFFFSFLFFCVIICLSSLGFLCFIIESMLGC